MQGLAWGVMGRYTTDTSYKEFEQMRMAMEPLTFAAGVDVFFYGASPPSGLPCPAVDLGAALTHKLPQPDCVAVCSGHLSLLQSRATGRQCGAVRLY